MFWPDYPVPVGVLRAVPRPTHDQLIQQQITAAVSASGAGDLTAVLASGETWTVE
jgi:2-oxoglutarate ferredoxin oxidoreductase subunit beta